MILGFFALSKCELSPFTGGIRLQMELSDASGRINGVMWDKAAELAYPEIKEASVVKVRGMIGVYRGQLQLHVEKVREATPDEYDLSELLPSSQFPLEELEAGIAQMIDLIEDEALRRVVEGVLNDDEIRPRFFESPAGTRWHHGYLRGLAEHSLSMAQAVGKLAEHYTFLDRSLLISAALLHDIGKIRELEVKSSLEYTAEGRLIGHIVIGYEIVKKAAERLDLSEDMNVRKLLHMILSHQGKKEYSVPVEPMFEEAFVLYFVDEIDSKLNAIGRIRAKPENQGASFSEWVKLLETHIYLDRKEKQETETEAGTGTEH